MPSTATFSLNTRPGATRFLSRWYVGGAFCPSGRVLAQDGQVCPSYAGAGNRGRTGCEPPPWRSFGPLAS